MEQLVDGSVNAEAGSSQDSSSLFLWGAAAAVVLGAAGLWGGIVLHVIGYVLASLLAFTLVALFRRRSVERTVKEGVGVPHWINVFAVGVLIAGFAVSVAQAWMIASYLS